MKYISLKTSDNNFQKIFLNFTKTLPQFPDGRLNFSSSRSAPVIIIFLKYQDEFLILKRSQKVLTYHSLWNTIAGYLDSPMSLSEHINNELKEELGLLSIPPVKFGQNYTFLDKTINKTWLIFPCLIEFDRKPNIKLDWEHSEYKWLVFKKLKGDNLVPNFLTSLKKVYETDN